MRWMTTTVVARFAAGASVALLAIGCSSDPVNPSRPPTTNPPPPTEFPPPPPRIDFPPLSGPSRTYIFDGELVYPVSDFTRKSRFVLYDNGAFELQYPPNQYGPGLFRGAYQDANGAIMFLFEFQGRSVGTPWEDATGTLKSDSLTVQYSEGMQHADFENAVYRLMP